MRYDSDEQVFRLLCDSRQLHDCCVKHVVLCPRMFSLKEIKKKLTFILGRKPTHGEIKHVIYLHNIRRQRMVLFSKLPIVERKLLREYRAKIDERKKRRVRKLRRGIPDDGPRWSMSFPRWNKPIPILITGEFSWKGWGKINEK